MGIHGIILIVGNAGFRSSAVGCGVVFVCPVLRVAWLEPNSGGKSALTFFREPSTDLLNPDPSS